MYKPPVALNFFSSFGDSDNFIKLFISKSHPLTKVTHLPTHTFFFRQKKKEELESDSLILETKRAGFKLCYIDKKFIFREKGGIMSLCFGRLSLAGPMSIYGCHHLCFRVPSSSLFWPTHSSLSLWVPLQCLFGDIFRALAESVAYPAPFPLSYFLANRLWKNFGPLFFSELF